ncbi:MAG TPA: glutathione S-transferase family protein [Candidatus Eisenbacteria bacterium]|nr:glutathione S-transferase family protein [Candidatus Eisenbacteria bacterium]
MKLYCFPRSGNSREVKLILAEKGLSYEPVDIHAKDFDKQDPEFRKASPGGKVPAIIDGDVYLSEAFEINQYLERKYPDPPVMPANEDERKRIREWVAVYDKKLVLRIGLLVIECLLKPKDQQSEAQKEKLRGEIREALGDLDRMLEGKEYLFGAYSLADASVTPHLAALPILGMSIPAEYKRLTAWFARIQARPSFKQSQS